MSKQRFQWPQVSVTRLLALYKSGASADFMALTMSTETGFSISRSSIINKLERLGFTDFTGHIGRIGKAEIIPERKAPLQLVPERNPGKLSLDEVQDIDGCRWPSGTKGNFTFCGNHYDHEGPFPYCSDHLRKAVRSAA